jgi:hypothetical protein
MQVVINTQYKENYGTDADPYWKFKGGTTYIIAASDREDADKIVELGMPTLTALIENSGSMCEEYIVGTSIQADSALIYEDWETPIQLMWANGRWSAYCVTENGEYSFMRSEVARKIQSWDLMMAGERENYVCTYVLRDSRIVKESELSLEIA